MATINEIAKRLNALEKRVDNDIIAGMAELYHQAAFKEFKDSYKPVLSPFYSYVKKIWGKDLYRQAFISADSPALGNTNRKKIDHIIYGFVDDLKKHKEKHHAKD